MNSVNINTNDFKLKTGDLLVCDDLQHDDWGLFSWVIKFFTKSDYSHVGMIVVDPEMTNPALKGAYVWTSGTSDVPDAEDGKKKFGVQFVELEEFIKTYGGKIYLRRLKCESEEQYHKIFNIDVLREIHQVEYRAKTDETFNCEIPFGQRGRVVYIKSSDKIKVDEWVKKGFSESMKTPDETLMFVDKSKAQQILTDQIN